jgi:hypothetical protein
MLTNEFGLERLSAERQAEWEKVIREQDEARVASRERYEPSKKAPGGSSWLRGMKSLNPFSRKNKEMNTCECVNGC